MPDLFSLREKEIFETLKSMQKFKFALIGGYAVTSYTLPRFSVDCDIVVKDEIELEKIKKVLVKLGYAEALINREKLPYSGTFVRFEKKILDDFIVSIDILFGKVSDRQTGIAFPAEWIFENSDIRSIKGKTITEELKVRVASPDALIVMKISSGRINDIRDVFMLIVQAKSKKFIKEEISRRYDFSERFLRLKEKVNSKQFKDSLQGVFGFIEDKLFEKHKRAVLELESA